MGEHTVIDYQLKLHGVPLRWQSEITVWDPPHRFADQQRRGPYRWWHHEHSFTDADGGTLARDRVSYSVWGSALINKLLVAPDLKKIFDYRRRKLRELLAVDGG